MEPAVIALKSKNGWQEIEFKLIEAFSAKGIEYVLCSISFATSFWDRKKIVAEGFADAELAQDTVFTLRQIVFPVSALTQILTCDFLSDDFTSHIFNLHSHELKLLKISKNALMDFIVEVEVVYLNQSFTYMLIADYESFKKFIADGKYNLNFLKSSI